MSAVKLNVEVRADIGGLIKGLKDAEKTLADFGSKAQSVGGRMFSALSAPLGAIGALSIQAAGQYENLRNAIVSTMTDAGRSTNEALAEVNALRKAAMAPGLDFEQAVRASIRLQNVGYSAEQARVIVEQLANAITMSGGNAEDLSRVTRQFAQMIAQGRIMAEDLGTISESFPKIAQLSEKAFGSFNAEQLRAQGVTAAQFVAGITKEMAGLKRVEGGIQNSLVNAGSAVKQALGSIGDEVNKAFNLSKKSEEFSNFVGDMAAGFAALDAPTKRFIIGLAATAVAAGPAIKAIGLVSSTLGSISAGAGIAVKALQSVSDFTASAIKTFNGLNTATKALTLFALATVVYEVGKALYEMNRQMTDAEYAAQALGEVNKQAARGMAEEKVEAEKLVKVLTSETSTRKEKGAALERLKKINAQYFGDLSIEKSSVEQINTALGKYLVLIEKRAKLSAASQKLVEIEGQLLDVQTRMEEAQPGVMSFQGVKNAMLSMGDATKFAMLQAQDLGKNFKAEEAGLVARKNALLGLVGALQKEGITTKEATDIEGLFGANLKTSTNAAGGKKAAVEKLTEAQKAYKEVLADIASAKQAGEVFGDGYERQADAIGKGMEKLLEKGFLAGSNEMMYMLRLAQELRDSLGKPMTQSIVPGPAENAALDNIVKNAQELRKVLESAQVGGMDANGMKAVAAQAEILRKALADAEKLGLPVADLQKLAQDAASLKDNLSGSRLPAGWAGSPDQLDQLLAQAVALKLAIEQAAIGNGNMDALVQKADALGKTLQAIDTPGIAEAASEVAAMKGLTDGIMKTLATVKVASIEDGKILLDAAAADAEIIRSAISNTRADANAFGGLITQVETARNKVLELKASLGAGLPALPSNTGLAPVKSTEPTKDPLAGLTKTTPKAIDETTDAVTRYIDVARQLGVENQNFSAGIQGFAETWKNTFSLIESGGTVMQKVAMQIGQSMMDAADSGSSSLKDLARNAVSSAAKIVRAWIQQGVAAAVSKALSSIPFPFNIAAGAAAGGIAGGLFNKALGALKIPGFADGAIVAGPTLAMVGEYAGARGNPEVIMPANKLQNFIDTGNTGYIASTRVSGRDLLIVIEAEQRNAKRSRGY